MKYIYWTMFGILARRPGPDEIEWDLNEFKNAGFGAILSLRNNPKGLNHINKHGFAYKLLPLPNYVPPSVDDFFTYQHLLSEALAFISQNVAVGTPALVHCHAGKDRTGVVLVCYLLEKILSYNQIVFLFHTQSTHSSPVSECPANFSQE